MHLREASASSGRTSQPPNTSSSRILASGLVPREKLTDCENSLGGSANEERLLDLLVERRLLTKWQAQQIKAGRTTGFFLEHYKLLSLLGAGGMGQVFRAEDTQLGRQVARALEHARERGIIHRDIKPSNILLAQKAQAKLADLGLAKFFGPRGDTPAALVARCLACRTSPVSAKDCGLKQASSPAKRVTDLRMYEKTVILILSRQKRQGLPFRVVWRFRSRSPEGRQKVDAIVVREYPQAIILGMSETGLGALRLLGTAGIRCWGLEVLAEAPGFWSRFCRRRIRLPRDSTDEQIVETLEDLAKNAKGAAVLLPTSDRYVRLLSAARVALGSRYRFLLPDHSVVQALLNKAQFSVLAHRLGVPTPVTYVIRDVGELSAVDLRINYPWIVKPSQRIPGGPPFPKTVTVRSVDEKEALLRRLSGIRELELVVQEYIPGDDQQEISIAVCVDKSGQQLATFAARKCRQGNFGAGVGTYVESHHDDEAETLALEALDKFCYFGVAEVELKRHAATGRLHVIEVNPRIWSQVSLPVALGLNFPLMYFQLALKEDVPPAVAVWRRVAWQDLWDDFYATFSGGGYRRLGAVSSLGWMREALAARAHPYFSWSDPGPAVHRLRHVVCEVGVALPRNRLRRLRWRRTPNHVTT